MNTTTLTDLADRIPSRSDAASTIASAFDDVTDRLPHHLPEIDLPDLSKPARRTRRAVARVVPGMSTSRIDRVRDRTSARWMVVGALLVLGVAAVVVLRRRARSHQTEQRRDDWMTTPSGNSRSADTDSQTTDSREPSPARS